MRERRTRPSRFRRRDADGCDVVLAKLFDEFAVLFAGAYVWLLVEAWRGRARLGLCAGLLLLATPWLVPWYAVWAVPLAAVEEDAAARWLALGLSAYLLRDAVPL